MKRRTFVVSSTLGTIGLGTGQLLPAAALAAHAADATHAAPAGTRRILVAGGTFDAPFIRYMAALTGKARPRLCLLPTASADSLAEITAWFASCEPLNVEAYAQESFVTSARQSAGWDEVLLSMDGIVASGGNALNQQAIWKAQGIDVVLRQAWERGIVLGGASAGSLCWFEEGTTDSRPKELSTVRCLGFLAGSHAPHYDREPGSRALYQTLIGAGRMKPGYACDDAAGIYFEDGAPKRVVSTRADAKAYHVGVVGGRVVERVLEPESIA